MTREEFNTLNHSEIFERDYAGRILMTPLVLEKTTFEIAKLIDRVASAVDGKAKVVIHCLFESTGHVSKSQHYLGKACDFHIVPTTKMSYVDQIELIEEVFENFGITEKIGLGIYPTWNNKGFHVDVRGYKARWGYLGKDAVSFTDALKYAVDHKL